jgi:aspartate ammonia-lyase
MEHRIEKDMLGEKQVPLDAYWGIHTQRAIENFPLSGRGVNARLIKAMALVKKACCLANVELGYLAPVKAEAISAACDEVIEGGLRDHFPVDEVQGGAGTSTNMNVNEVIANRAAEKLGGSKGDHSKVNPIEDVNLHQSTNDVYPTALKVALIFGLRDLSRAIETLQGAFQNKEKEFADTVKIGRTEMQEAVPMTLGAEFSAFSEALARDRWRTFKSEERLRTVNLGGTAVGTGITAPRRYIFLVIEKLRDLSGLGLSRGENLVDQTANADAFVEVSGILKAHATNLIKISNDLRMLNLLGEVKLPEMQAGSSIMPGKVNPVILEAAIQAGLKAMAADLLVTEAASRATFQINEFMPVISSAMLGSMDLLANTDRVLALHAENMHAGTEACARYFYGSPALITAFVPYIGYDKATEVIEEYSGSGSGDLRAFLAKKLGEDTVARVLSPENLTSLGYRENEKNT